MSSQAHARRADEALERSVFEAVSIDVEHVPDEDVRAYDGRLSETALDRVDPVFIAAETPVELKTCFEWIDDRHSWNGRRRGRWWIGRRAHEALKDLGGAYLLAILDEDDEPIEALLVRAEVLDDYLADRWTGNGSGHNQGDESAQLRWSAVIDPDDLEARRGSA